MNLVLWIIQIALGLAFIGAGFNHATQRNNPRRGMEWMRAVPARLLGTIGVLEILGGVGLVVPAATGIAPLLTPIAAAALVVLMLFAATFHLRRSGEAQNAVMNLSIGLVALFVALGRFVLVPVA